MTEDSTPPILGHALDQPSALTLKNLIDDVRRNRQIPVGIVPPACILEFDGDITDWLVRDGIAKPFEPWPCFHTSMFAIDLEGVTCGVIARTIGGPYAVRSSKPRRQAHHRANLRRPRVSRFTAPVSRGGNQRDS